LTADSTLQDDRVDILGVNVSAISMEDAVEAIQRWIGSRVPNYVCVTGVHGIIESLGDSRLQRIHNEAGLVTPDGMPLVWMARSLGFNRTRRVYGPDLMRAMSELSAARGYRQFYYGGDHGIAERLKKQLTRDYPGLEVVGTLTPPFRPLTAEEDAAVTACINAIKPDIVWIGLSTPKQELWMAEHVGRIDAPVMIGVGAAFDFLAGAKKQAPAWMRQSGLEWLFRLAQEPRRLWRRYLAIVPRFLVLALLQLMKARYPAPGRGGRGPLA
jgi:N-acetylglucosaminyldiphosphoundecaprenol N-acetyl-beta-D-mannosaminyltransferase